MKANELEKLEKIHQEKNLSKEIKEKIIKKVTSNFLIAVDILLLFIVLMFAARNLPKTTMVLIYKLASLILFVFTLVLFETAYKKDDNNVCVHGIELFFLSVTTLLMPYIFIEKTSVFTAIVGAYFTAYYILKNLVIYRTEKTKYLREVSDIAEIVKKESQDTLAKEHIEKVKQEAIKEEVLVENKGNETKKKRGRPRKEEKNLSDEVKKVSEPTRNKQTSKQIKKTDTSKKENNQKDKKTEPKKVGRPRKNTIEQQTKTEKRKPGRPKKVAN